MTLKSELVRVKRAAAARAAAERDTPAGFSAERARRDAAREAWTARFIAGGDALAGRPPEDAWSSPPGPAARAYELTHLKGRACYLARYEGLIPPLAYLPDMAAADRAACDWTCGTFYRIERSLAVRAGEDPDAAVADQPPEWAALDGPNFGRAELLRAAPRAPEPEEDLTLLSDELERRLAVAKAKVAEFEAKDRAGAGGSS